MMSDNTWPLLPADKVCKQFGPRSGPAEYVRPDFVTDGTDGIPERPL